MTTEALEAIATFSVAWTEAKAREAEAERVYREAATVREAAQAALHGVVTRACAESKSAAVAVQPAELADINGQFGRVAAERDQLAAELEVQKKINTDMAERVAKQSELLGQRAEAAQVRAAEPAGVTVTDDDGDVDSLPSDLGTQTTIFDGFADVIEEPQVYRDDKEHVPAGERHGNSPAEEVPTWRKMPIAETGWEETLDPDVWSAIMSAPATPEIHTAGDLADALLAGENFGLVALELNDVYGLVEQISEDDPEPIKFPGAEPEIETGLARNIVHCGKCKATFDATGRAKCPSCSKPLAEPAPKTVDVLNLPPVKRERKPDPNIAVACPNCGAAAGAKCKDYRGKGKFTCKERLEVAAGTYSPEPPAKVESASAQLSIDLEPAAAPVTHLNDLTDFPAAVADLLFPKGISTVETLTERMAEECAHIADMELPNKLTTFFVRLGCRMSQAQHATRAMVAHLEPAAAAEVEGQEQPAAPLSRPCEVCSAPIGEGCRFLSTGAARSKGFYCAGRDPVAEATAGSKWVDPDTITFDSLTHLPQPRDTFLKKLAKAGLKTLGDLKAKYAHRPEGTPEYLLVYSVFRGIGIGIDPAHDATCCVLRARNHFDTDKEPDELEAELKRLDGVPYGYGIKLELKDRTHEYCNYVGTEKKARLKAMQRPNAKEVLECKPYQEAEYVRAFGRGRM